MAFQPGIHLGTDFEAFASGTNDGLCWWSSWSVGGVGLISICLAILLNVCSELSRVYMSLSYHRPNYVLQMRCMDWSFMTVWCVSFSADPLAAGNPVHAIACATRYSGWGHVARRNTLVTGGSCFAHVWFWGDLVQVVAHPSAGWKCKYVSIRRDLASTMPEISASLKMQGLESLSAISAELAMDCHAIWALIIWIILKRLTSPCAIDKQDKLAAGLVQLAQGPQSQACAA